jgi:hypothetical protein
MPKIYLVVLGVLFAIIIAVGLLMFKPWQNESQIVSSQTPSGSIVVNGGQILISIIAELENGSPAPGVQVVATDEVQGTSIVGTTNTQGKSDISLISGHTYTFIAEFNTFSKAIEHNFDRPQVVEILLSNDGLIESILLE